MCVMSLASSNQTRLTDSSLMGRGWAQASMKAMQHGMSARTRKLSLAQVTPNPNPASLNRKLLNHQTENRNLKPAPTRKLSLTQVTHNPNPESF